jgi:amino acid transporter
MNKQEDGSEKKSLAGGALGAFESIVMGIAGTAPAYSVSAATATIVAVVGVLSVASIFYCGLIMFGIMLAFIHLKRITPHAGAAYAWVGHVFGAKWGFFAGWGLLVASVFFMVSATVPAAQSTLVLVGEFLKMPELKDSTAWVAFTGAAWLSLVTFVVARGIKHASYTQILLTGLETAVIFVLIVGAIYRFIGQPAHVPSLSWFAFTPQNFAQGALTALFFYWGWDVTMNLTEETKGGHPDPASRGAFWAMINLILFFCIMMIVVLIALTDEEIANADTSVLYVLANKLFPWPWGYLAVLSTLLSTMGTIETQILQFSRSMFAMARDKMLHPRYAKIHPRWQTPWVATFVIWFLGILLLIGSSFMESVKKIQECSIYAIDFQICFYMSLTGFACAWHYRDKLKEGVFAAFYCVLWPLASALFMVFIAIYCVPTFDRITNIVGIGGILLGFVPLLLNAAWRDKPLEQTLSD